jgi:hypothetical protein
MDYHHHARLTLSGREYREYLAKSVVQAQPAKRSQVGPPVPVAGRCRSKRSLQPSAPQPPPEAG